MKNQSRSMIQIKDSAGGKYRVKSVGKNSETLQTSEALESVAAVKKHISAMKECWYSASLSSTNPSQNRPSIHDLTKSQVFAKKEFATGKGGKK